MLLRQHIVADIMRVAAAAQDCLKCTGGRTVLSFGVTVDLARRNCAASYAVKRLPGNPWTMLRATSAVRPHHW
eukprot:761774-Amphidinium_carterae.1